MHQKLHVSNLKQLKQISQAIQKLKLYFEDKNDYSESDATYVVPRNAESRPLNHNM